MKKLFTTKRPTINWFTALVCIVAYYSFVVNIPILKHFVQIFSDMQNFSYFFALSVPIVLFTLVLSVFTLFSSKYLFKPFFILLLLSSGPVFYSQLFYHIVYDYDMIQNFAQTNIYEARSYLTTQSFIIVFLISVIPAFFLLITNITYPKTFVNGLIKKLIIILSCFAVIIFFYILFSKSYMPLFRNNKNLIKELIPSNYIAATVKYVKKQYFYKEIPFVTIGNDATIFNPKERPEIMVIIIGETARAANFKQNGYSRNTTPYTDGINNLTFYKNVESCGTATAKSIPCMFSNLTREKYDEDIAQNESSLVDILSKSGYGIKWIDNDGGCKGPCTRQPHEIIDPSTENSPLCDGETCYDEVLLPKLKNALKEIKTQHRIIFLHLIGSHGPTYYKRVPEKYKIFKPSCETANIQNCTTEELFNAYDNTISYTDYIIKEIKEILTSYEKDFGVGIFYISDHGESLGEFDTYLHGAPYMLAPKEQTHVPMLTWFSDSFIQDHDLDLTCLNKIASVGGLSQDYFFHSLLGIMDNKTESYDEKLDFFSKCRNTSK